MHRSYQSILPCHNKLLQQKWDTTYYNEHRRKVAEVKPMVDTKAPRTYMHLHLKLKKLQLEEERLATIERDNRILLEKMAYIMRTRGRVDNKNSYDYKSLNREKRRRELLRITHDNQEILRRITLRKPEYDHAKWQNDWKENQEFMDNISHYPMDWWSKDKNGGTSSRQQTARGSSRGNGSARSEQNERAESKAEAQEEEKKEDEQTKPESKAATKEEEKKEDEQPPMSEDKEQTQMSEENE